MSIQRVAIIFDDRQRPETTGVYCRRALSGLVQVEHFLPTDLERVPREGFDLYLHIDDGLGYRLPGELRPSAWWVIDTHLEFEERAAKAREFDFVFAAQRDGAARLRGAGVNCLGWLPLACDPEVHRRHEIAKEFDVCFVGNIVFGARSDLLELIRRRFPRTFIGQRYFEEMARTYSASRVVFNRSIANDVNMRVFEALACGSLLITNDLSENGLASLFQDGVHLATYREAEELLDKIDYYLRHEQVRERIGATGRAEALGQHTYRDRMRRLLDEVQTRLAARGLGTGGIDLETGEPSQAGYKPTPAHDPSYFEFARPEVLALVPLCARRVLEIGCGAGRLGEALKARQAAEVYGIEFVPAAAERAKGRLDQVLVADVEQMDAAFAKEYFDAIVCADVLEHLREPQRLLRRIRAWLKPGGRLVASIPNVRHHSILRSLLDGNWSYQTAGLLDRDHLRFFTRREIEKMLFRAEFAVQELQAVPGGDYAEWVGRGRPGEVKVGRLHVGGMDPAHAEEFYIYQYLLTAVAAPEPDFGLTSIVLVTHNEVRYTQQCIDSIRLVTDEAYELIVVDNGSTDGTAEYLDAMEGVTLIANPDNRGFPAAANQGMRAARGMQVLLLNNDCVVTTGWLRRLLWALYRDEKVGLVGPCSNSTNGPQRVNPGYDDLGDLDGFAWDWGAAHDGEHLDTDPLGGFCLLIKREVIDRIGLLDERFGLGGTEDDDYCLRAVRAGFRTVLARDAYVHHFGHRTFIGSGIDFDAHHQKSLRLFRAKWEAEERLPAGSLDTGLTSIVILAHNQLEFTRQCVESIRRYTSESHEFVFVDNASTDGTAEYLRSVPNARVITNAENRGFPAAANQGMRAATGDQILLLNNDTVVTPGWLGRLVRALRREPTIGLAGPSTNFASGPQVAAVDYQDLQGLERFAERTAGENAGVVEETDRLVGFCLLIKREVVEKIGFLDERFGVGCFEDDDYTLRAVRAGYRAVIARDCFVHHYGGRTFVGTGVDFGGLMRRNERLFREKWAGGEGDESGGKAVVEGGAGLAAANGEGVGDGSRIANCKLQNANCNLGGRGDGRYTVRVGPGGGLVLERKDVRRSLCMIARDNERTIVPALLSIRPWVDEMIVVDTGSKDGTAEIAGRLGARVHSFPWCDSFSKARNESLKYARGEWNFWMDSDDTIDRLNGRKLRELTGRDIDPNILGLVVEVHCPGRPEDAEANVTVVHHVKLIRNRPELRFDRRIHEQIIPAINRAGGEIAATDLFVVHSGYDQSPEGQKRKLERDLRLLHLELAEEPNHPFTLFNLGMTYADVHEHEKAAGYLRASLRYSGERDSHLRKVYALLVYSLDQLKRAEEALDVCREGLQRFPRDDELRFRKGVLLHELGRLQEAAETYQDLLARRDEWHYTSILVGLTGFMARQNLAVVYEDLGDLAKAEEQWRLVVQDRPHYGPGLQGLGNVLLRQHKAEEAREVAGLMAGEPRLACSAAVLGARATAERGDWRAARRELEGAVARFADDTEPLNALCELLFYHGEPAEVEEVLRQLIRREPENPHAYHNLGMACAREQRHAEAVEAYRKSLELRPESALTWLCLGYALRDAGRTGEAVAAWEQVLRLEPGNREAAQVLAKARAG